MRHLAPASLLSLLGLCLALGCSEGTGPADPVRPTFKAGGRSGFGFNGEVRGFPHGAVRLTGGGSFDPTTASNTVPRETSVVSGGGFDCTEPVAQGPLAGCATGQGVRWDTAQLLASTSFKCTASEAALPATTDEHTAVLLAHFYRAGDGDNESFTAQIIVSDGDLSPDPGVQNLWVQGVGCGTAIVNFN
ncbi:MAG TPA: hypothetical protein VEU27_10880 [Gemmatimonadales bacterium]|jgi:hypothetical protein|nr:hypothetical protein [Gemmatimonadales bacterium]